MRAALYRTTYAVDQGCSGASVSLAPSDADSAGTRYCSDAHWPRSISLQRSEQNGRKGESVVQRTSLPQDGQRTVRDSDLRSSGESELLMCSGGGA